MSDEVIERVAEGMAGSDLGKMDPGFSNWYRRRAERALKVLEALGWTSPEEKEVP